MSGPSALNTGLLQINGVMIAAKLLLIIIVILISLVVAFFVFNFEKRALSAQQPFGNNSETLPHHKLQPVPGKTGFSRLHLFSMRLLLIKPAITLLLGFMVIALIPWGSQVTIAGTKIYLSIAIVEMGILYVIGVWSLMAFSAIMFEKDNAERFSFLQTTKKVSLLFRFESILIISVIALMMITGSQGLRKMVDLQVDSVWNIFYQLPGFVVFVACGFAMMHLVTDPLNNGSVIKSDQNPVSGEKKLYLIGKNVNLFLFSAIIGALYLGGFDIPIVSDGVLSQKMGMNPVTVLQCVVFLLKTLVILALLVWVRRKLPSRKYEWFMNRGWKILLWIGLVNLIGTGIVMLLIR